LLAILGISGNYQSVERRYKETTLAAIATIVGIAGGTKAIAAPSPPTLPTFTLIKLLPFASIIFTDHRRSAINPNFLSFSRCFAAMGTAKMTSVGSRIDPIGGSGAKGFYIHGPE
jgi:hypothetical protein